MSVISQELHLPMGRSVEWRALADHKIGHLTELEQSGRWDLCPAPRPPRMLDGPKRFYEQPASQRQKAKQDMSAGEVPVDLLRASRERLAPVRGACPHPRTAHDGVDWLRSPHPAIHASF
jgi:hypothetical protein